MAHTSMPPWRGAPAAAPLAAADGVPAAGATVGAAAAGAVGLPVGALVGAAAALVGAAAGALVCGGAEGAGEQASSSQVVPISPPATVAVRIKKVRRFKTLMLDGPFS